MVDLPLCCPRRRGGKRPFPGRPQAAGCRRAAEVVGSLHASDAVCTALRMGDSLAVELPALTRAALVRIQVPQPGRVSYRRQCPVKVSGLYGPSGAPRSTGTSLAPWPRGVRPARPRSGACRHPRPASRAPTHSPAAARTRRHGRCECRTAETPARPRLTNLHRAPATTVPARAGSKAVSLSSATSQAPCVRAHLPGRPRQWRPMRATTAPGHGPAPGRVSDVRPARACPAPPPGCRPGHSRRGRRGFPAPSASPCRPASATAPRTASSTAASATARDPPARPGAWPRFAG